MNIKGIPSFTQNIPSSILQGRTGRKKQCSYSRSKVNLDVSTASCEGLCVVRKDIPKNAGGSKPSRGFPPKAAKPLSRPLPPPTMSSGLSDHISKFLIEYSLLQRPFLRTLHLPTTPHTSKYPPDSM